MCVDTATWLADMIRSLLLGDLLRYFWYPRKCEQRPKRFMQNLYMRGPMVKNVLQNMESDMVNYLKR
jgi:hypothetical protein